ncbi:MAG: hypothetical protein J6A91_07050 [Bacteroidales bacterium]|nr:hypothetical protein [Bacteroidales bacterium]
MLAEIDNFTAEEYQQYIESLGNMGDYQNIINTAVEEAELRGRAMGREEGREEGRVEGQFSKAVEVAAKLIATGMSKAEAASLVGLSEEDLDS